MAVNFSQEAAKAGSHPRKFSKREQKLLESVQSNESHVVKYAGLHTSVGGDASESIAVSGVLSSDLVIVTVKTAGATPRSVVAAAAGSGTISVTMSGDPSTDHVLSYVVLRANT